MFKLKCIRRASCLFPLLCLFGASHAFAGPSISVRAMGIGTEEMPELYLKNARGHEEIQFSMVQPGAKMKVSGGDSISLYSKGIDENGRDTFVVEQTAKVPSGSAGVLLLGWLNDDKVGCVAIKDNFGAAKYNDWLMINTTKVPVAFMIGEEKKPVLVKAGESRNWEVKAKENSGISVVGRAKVGGKVEMVLSTYWPIYAGKRNIALIVEDGDEILVRLITDKVSGS